MIPVKLALRNFMSYRENVPAISFEGIHTACISGNNGNGKSALIDAITWALWGQSRAASDDELVHAGQSDTEVEFEFASGAQHYRIIRKHSRPKTQKSSGQTILEFQLVTPEGNKVLTGETISQTQSKITNTLHMDYETFINSAFLRQGRADEFTKKRPSERKQVLGNILQLSIYDELENQAKEMVKEQETVITQLESFINSLQQELVLKPSYQTEFEQAQKDLSQAEKLTGEQHTRLVELRKSSEELEKKKTQSVELAAHIKDTESNYQLWNEQALKCQEHIRSYEELICQRAIIEDNFRKLTEARKKYQEMEQKLKQFNTLTQSQHRLELAIVKAGEDLNRSHAIIENRIKELVFISQKLPQLQEQMEQINSQLRVLDESESRLDEKRDNLKLMRARVHFLQAEQVRLAQEVRQVEEKLKLLAHQAGVTCPLCETELGEEGHRRIETKYIAERDNKNELLKSGLQELTQKEAGANTLEKEVLQSEKKMKQESENLQNHKGSLGKSITDAVEATNKIVEEKKGLAEIENKLALREFAIEEQKALTGLEKEIQALGYSSSDHETLRAALADLEKYEAPKRQLEEADRLIAQEKENSTRACQTAEGLRLKLESDRQRRESLQREILAAATTAGELVLAESRYQDLLSQQKRLQGMMGEAKAKLDRLVELESRHKEKQELLARATKQVKIYKDLTQAFGKKGIQAMLIETALPEIEIEANRLLARMTENRMNIKLETQRETKKGDVLETLDINISDELGTRNYEMFSGGEAFRIDFAIRIALSKLLARRAGAPLPTLIIDEGFGTQDSTGMEKIKEAITSIQDDFEKILVITHISDFKDSFPMRIEVIKTLEGSTVYLN